MDRNGNGGGSVRSVEYLRTKTTAIAERAGVPAADAARVADALVTADMRGIFSHGVVRLARYLDCIRAGGIKPAAELEVIRESPNSLMASAAGGLGIPAAVKTMERLLEKSKTQAISIATVSHSDHYGAAGYYAMMAADRGLVGFSASNTCPLVAPTGGRATTIGNNPFAYAAPGARHRAVLFDICMSKVAAGKLVIAAEAGKKIPEGLILTKDGKPTTDPGEIWHDAVMLPFGEHKGYGLAVMVEMMTGVLGMAGMMAGVHSWNTQPGRDADTGHSFVVVNPEFFGGGDAFRSRIDEMVDELKACPPCDGSSEVLYPGELEWRREAKALADGVELPAASVAELARAAQMAGVEL